VNYMFFKFPIYFILLHKVLQISKVRGTMKEAGELTPDDESKLTAFMAAYGCVFVLLLLA